MGFVRDRSGWVMHMQRYTNPVLFLLVITNAEMYRACKDDGAILLSIESFQMRLSLPKVYYIFYEHCTMHKTKRKERE